MPKKAATKRRKLTTRSGARTENPGWLRQDPSGAAPSPPVHSRVDVLPFVGLSWEDFERLCVRLAAIDTTIEAVWAYGKSGHAQHGIDALVRLTDGTYHVWQSKRHQTISKARIKAAVDFFLKRKWAHRATRFVLAVACELSSPSVVEAIEAARDRLRQRNIEFEALGPTRLTQMLIAEPELVDDFFGRPWVPAVCPPEAIERLRQRLSRFDAAVLRAGLRTHYNSWIATVDPGLPIVGVDAQGRTRASIPLPDRYIRPDLLIQSAETEVAAASDEAAANAQAKRERETGEREAPMRTGSRSFSRALLRERRVAIDGYLGGQKLSLVLGEAGTGKSSLLRFLALDILSDKPELAVTREQYRDLIPVWLPFAFWVRLSADQRAPVAIEEAAAAFLRAQGGQDLADRILQAVMGKRVVILVDGIDEASDQGTAQTLLASLTTFVDRAGIPVVATSRPHGARSLTALGGAWERATLAPLSAPQRHSLATLWLSVLERFEADATASNSQIRARARRKADRFVAALQANAGIARLSQTPLFLLAFVSLHGRGQDLPRNRFAASKEIVDQLMEHQPSRRAVSALATDAAQTEPRLRDRIICDFAFGLQAGELTGAIPDAAAEDDAVARASGLILRRQNTGNQDAAEATARAIFSFTEERAGLLVNKAPGNIGFLHLSLQEFLAARHLLQLMAQERLAFVTANAITVRWREPILYLLAMTQTEAETGQLVEAIENARPTDIAEQAARNALLTDAVFADFSHDLGVVRRITTNFLSEAESTAWGARQTHLLTATVEGLFSESVSNLCRDKLAQWLCEPMSLDMTSCCGAARRWALRPLMTRWCRQRWRLTSATSRPPEATRLPTWATNISNRSRPSARAAS
ncbi:NACHT domain-containing protein [Bradyrhizobium sp. 25ACV]